MVKAKVSSAEARVEKARVRQDAKKAYTKRKVELLKKEGQNRRTIAAIATSDGKFWKLFDRSAVFYVYDIANKLHIRPKPRLLEDSDYHNKATHGVVTIASLEKFTERLEKCGLKRLAKQEGYIAYRYPQEFTEKKVQEFLRSNEDKWTRANKLILPKVIMPQLRSKYVIFATTAYHTIAALPVPAREMFGDEFGHLLTQLIRDFPAAANGHMSAEDYFREFEENLQYINGHIFTLSELRLIDADRSFLLMTQFEEVRMVLEEEKEKYEKYIESSTAV